MTCKCGHRYCDAHRLPMDHACTYLEQERIDHQTYLKTMMRSAKGTTYQPF